MSLTEEETFRFHSLLLELMGSEAKNSLDTLGYLGLKELLGPVFDALKEYENALRKAKGSRHAGEKFDFRGAIYKVKPFGTSTSYAKAYEIALTVLETLDPDKALAVKESVKAEFVKPRTQAVIEHTRPMRIASTE